MAWIDITEQLLPELPQSLLCVVPTGVRFTAALVDDLRRRGLKKFRDGNYLCFWRDNAAEKIAISIQTEFSFNAFVLRSSCYVDHGTYNVHSTKLARQLTRELNGAKYKLVDEKIDGVDMVFRKVSVSPKSEKRSDRHTFTHNGVVFTEVLG